MGDHWPRQSSRNDQCLLGVVAFSALVAYGIVEKPYKDYLRLSNSLLV